MTESISQARVPARPTVTHRRWRAFQPLRSRKVRVALATILAAFGAEYGLAVSEELIATILGVGVMLIWGIAHEDAGAKASRCRCCSPHP